MIVAHTVYLRHSSPFWLWSKVTRAPEIGSEKAARIAKAAHKNDTTLRTKALKPKCF